MVGAVSTAARDELTVASFNIHWGRGARYQYRPFDVVAAAREIDADVLVLQESWAPHGGPGQHDAIAAALGYELWYEPLARSVDSPWPKVVDRPDGARNPGTGTWGLAVLSRLPVSASATLPIGPLLRLDPPARALIRLDVQVGGRTLVVHGTHLAHLEVGVHRHRPALRAALSPTTTPAVLLGDMNMWGWNIDWMVPDGWRRARSRGGTYPAARRASIRIDHLLTTPSVEVLEMEVLPDLGSDHRPIRARLRLP